MSCSADDCANNIITQILKLLVPASYILTLQFTQRFCLLNHTLPLGPVLPIWYLHLLNVNFSILLPSYFQPAHWSCTKWFLWVQAFNWSVAWHWPPLWFGGQGSWLQIRWSGFNSRRYQIFWEVVGPERGPLSLMRIIEELFQGNKSSGLENRN
jgi:hypothetical protein